MNAARIEMAAVPYHARYLALVAEIERNFPVVGWKLADVDIWPLARLELHAEMYWSNLGQSRPLPPGSPLPRIAKAARPLRNLWKSRHDLINWIGRPRQAQAIFLGDGISLDLVAGKWQDRFGEAVFAALEKQGSSTFIMQSGNLARLPWNRPTFAANVLESRGAPTALAAQIPAELPGHSDVMHFLAREGVRAPSLGEDRLLRLARGVSATACAFERVLSIVKPRFAFVVTYYTGLGPAFLLACRRQGILSIDLQHCPQDGAHKAYTWSKLPATGYRTLPAVFWNWTAQESADIQAWADTLPEPWHRGLHGGHTQLASFLDDRDPVTRDWDTRFATIGNGARYEREILIALQPIGGHREKWNALVRQIEAAPAEWRWWIRRHPASSPRQDEEYPRLLALRKPNVLVDEAAAFPLPALLRHMSAVLSLASGASAEAAAFGVPAFFLSDEARDTFPGLLSRGCSIVVDPTSINTAIERIQPSRAGRIRITPPDLDETLQRLEVIAEDYCRLCRTAAQPTVGN